MSSRFLIFMLIWLAVLLAFDVYGFQLVKAATRNLTAEMRRWVAIGYWSLSVIAVISMVVYARFAQAPEAATIRAYAAGFFMSNLLFKLFLVVFALTDDLRRLFFWLARLLGQATDVPALAGLPVSRSEFLSRAAVAVAAIPAVGMIYGVARGGHRYQVHRHKILLPHLPNAFHGLKIVQLSDIHSGSFFSRAGIEKGIEMAMAQKPDLILFTGDLVNNLATEIEPYINLFNKLKAPMGVYSTLGNHDYADYVSWDSKEEKAKNLRRLMDNHARLGWDLLMDEHRILEKEGQQIALLGIQNWGAKGNFPKYGNLAKAYRGTESHPVKILMSHDPSHWDAQVRTQYPDIDLMLAGHTHGMQFGIESKILKFSPVQFMYKQWAGLYQEGKQYLNVNRGFGFIGYPGRLGIWPEITLLELVNKA